MAEIVTIDARFNGPPGSGNGGYTCGLLAKQIAGPSQVSLRAPPPLDTPLALEVDASSARLLHNGALIGEARAASLDLTPPPAPTLAQAESARARYRGLLNHRFETCFVCGASRAQHDGLELYTGAVEGADMVASTWTPSADLAGPDGRVREEFIHAALDCPSYWALPRAGEMMALLASLTSSIDAELPRAGEPLIVAAWALGAEGRKHRAATALYTADGAVLARAEALWIEPKS